jgi:NADH-quinone oxidoreductase subunit I
MHRLTHREDGRRVASRASLLDGVPPRVHPHRIGEYPEGDLRRGYERFPKRFVIDELRCVFGYVEARPCDAIRMDNIHAAPTTHASSSSGSASA